MLSLKKLYREELLQLALLLSLLRVDPDSYLDIQSIGVGLLDLNNGSRWNSDTIDSHTIIHRPVFIHPKNPDTMLLDYQRNLFQDLNSLGRFNRLNNNNFNNIHAYLLNIERENDTAIAGPSIVENAPANPSAASELTQEDMDLIEVLWKQDVDLGFTLVDPDPGKQASTSEKESPDDIEKLKALQAVNATKNEDDLREKDSEEKEDDPWAGLSYTVDLETGEYILTPGSGNNPSLSSSSSSSEDSAVETGGDQLLSSSSTHLDDPGITLSEDSLGLTDNFGLEDDFPSELLSDTLLGGTGVDGLLSNDTLGLPDGFNLEEALQLVGLNEVQPEDLKEESKKKEDLERKSEESSASSSSTSGCDTEADDMIHPPQFHHPHHHRSFQGRMPFVRGMNVDQRWPDLTSIFVPAEPFAHSTHHGYPTHGMSHNPYDPQRNVLLHNATLAPPVGDLNSTGAYHNVGGPSNLGSAVATSMNLTNNEQMGGDNTGNYKSEPADMMYYHTPPTDSINQTADGFLSLLNEDGLDNLMDMAINEGMYSMRLLESNNISGPAGGNGLHNASAGNSGGNSGVTNLQGCPDERLDASSDSAVSSMGSERVPSLSDGEWMETGSNSSHTQPDSHYSMDYASKYRMPYECSYSVLGRNGSPRCQGERIPPVAQKKHQMFGKRHFQDHTTGSPLAGSTHPTTPMKYDYEAQAIGAGAPGNAYSGPIEGAAGPQPDLKYSCSVDFSRHQTVPHLPGRTALEHLHHNHTYHLPPDSSGSMQRPITRDKKVRKSEHDEHLSRDEKRARALNVPITVQDIINLPMDEFNERLSKYDLSEAQLSLIRDIRRRGKNKVAAQNCRKRKLDQIISLADEVKEARDRKIRLIRERDYMLMERQRVKDKYSQLYRHISQMLHERDGHHYEYSLPQSTEGNVLLVSNNQTNPHNPRQNVEPKTKPEDQHKE